MMGIQFNGTTGQRIDFGEISSVKGLQTKSVLLKLQRTGGSGATSKIFEIGDTSLAFSTERFVVYYDANTSELNLYVHWSTTPGRWKIGSNPLPVNTDVHIGISYDARSTLNDAVFYKDGVIQSVTEVSTPVGTWSTAGTIITGLGGTTSGGTPFTGVLNYALCYNRILLADEFADAYRNRLAVPFRKGVVFNSVLWGCRGRQEFNGVTLTGTDFILDPVSRALGTPNGSPVGYGDQHLMIGEMT